MDFATQPVFVYKHVWREGDLIVWDNRYTMHCLMTT
jgi:alpha-ketoglutarate-dependent taurine dioxygenase